MKYRRIYLIYDKDDNYIFEGTCREIANKYNRDINSLWSSLSNVISGRIKHIKLDKKFCKVYLLDDEDNN